jgi:uncharacterized lipoprotein YajG
MQTKLIKHVVVIVTAMLVAACNDSPETIEPQEPVAVQETEEINAKLLESLTQISNKQVQLVESAGKDALEQLSEGDRQALIDLTIDESAKAVSEDAEKMVELLQDINGIND